MNKKIKNLFLAGALIAGLAGVSVSCTDYGDDINAQSKEIAALKGKVEELQKAIKDGAVITEVSTTADGYTIKLSNGKTYDISNGKAGVNGKDGKDGVNGKDGKDGKDGVWYFPDPDLGVWVKHEMVDGKDVATPTKMTILPSGTLLAEIKDGKLILKNVAGVEGDLVLDLNKAMPSLVFVPQCYVDGVEGMKYMTLRCSPLKGEKLDSKDEFWRRIDPDHAKLISPDAFAEYHVNGSDFAFDSTYTYSFIVKKDLDFFSTRGNATEDFAMTPEFDSYDAKNGILKVKVSVEGAPADWDKISVFALKATKDSVSYVSDYATLMPDEICEVRIADPKALSMECKKIADEHYRTGVWGISNPNDAHAPGSIGAYVNPAEPWKLDDNTLAAARAHSDTSVAFNSSIDIKKIVALHVSMCESNNTVAARMDREFSKEDLEAYGLTWKFELVQNYKIGDNKQDQKHFVTLEDGVFTPKVYEETGEAAIGRTPIVRVSVLSGEDVIEVAYIKVFISALDVTQKFQLNPVHRTYDDQGSYTGDTDENFFTANCDGDSLFTTLKQMNLKLYNKLGMSKDQFHALYNEFEDMPAALTNLKPEEKVGVAKDLTVVGDPQTGATHVIQWNVTASDLYALNPKLDSVYHYVRYYSGVNPELFVDIKLAAAVKDLASLHNYNVVEGDYIQNYWNAAKTITSYNVATPAQGDINPDHCIFDVDINAAFKTYAATEPLAGQMILSNKSITNLGFFFCNNAKDGMPTVKKIGEYTVKFRVSADSLQLYATIADGTEELIAEIENLDAAVAPRGWNMFTYNKDSEVAKKLLNTGEMYVLIGAKGTICGDEEMQVNINFQGKDHFRANIVRPVTITSKAKGNYVDAVNFGEKGSYITVADLLDPIDWRQYKFTGDNAFLWKYYGPFSVEILTGEAECDLNGTWAPVPATIFLTHEVGPTTQITDPVSGISVTVPNSASGYLTYKNNQTVVTKDFNIRVKANVNYGWGVIKTDWIVIPVKKTVGQ